MALFSKKYCVYQNNISAVILSKTLTLSVTSGTSRLPPKIHLTSYLFKLPSFRRHVKGGKGKGRQSYSLEWPY